MPTFRITRPGARHYGPPDKKTGERRMYVTGDTIDLPTSAGTDPKWNNLGLVLGGRNAPTGETTIDVAAEEAELNQEQANPAVKPAAGDIGADEDEEAATAAEKKKRQTLLSKLAKQVADSEGSSGFSEARKAVIEADLFEADTVPTKKAELLDALNELIAAEDEDDE